MTSLIQDIVQYIRDNKEWLFSGIGVFVLGLLGTIFGFWSRRRKKMEQNIHAGNSSKYTAHTFFRRFYERTGHRRLRYIPRPIRLPAYLTKGYSAEREELKIFLVDKIILMVRILVLFMMFIICIALILIIFSTIDKTFNISNVTFKDEANTIDAIGTDKKGRTALYRIITISRNYYWKLGSSELVVDSKSHTVSIESKLQINLLPKLENLTDIISIGVASCKGESFEENYRAFERANRIIDWLDSIILPKGVEHIYLISLGQYNELCKNEKYEREQRKLIIAGILEKEPYVDIKESFRDVLLKNQANIFHPLDITKYTNWHPSKYVLLQHR